MSLVRPWSWIRCDYRLRNRHIGFKTTFVFIAENPTIENSIAQPPKPACLKGN
jgi:hypothetical protein